MSYITVRMYEKIMTPNKKIKLHRIRSASFCGTMSPKPTVEMVVKVKYIHFKSIDL